MESKEKERTEGYPESAFRFWGEEREADIIYSVFLKKVSYKKSATDASAAVQQDDSSPESSVQFLSYLQWETLRIRTIKAASVQRLVEYLPIAVEQMDSVYINVFFSTYQTFSSLREALGILLKRYIELQEGSRKPEKDRQLKNIRSVVMMWLEESQDDFREAPDYPCLHMIEEFARDVSQDVELQLRAEYLMTSFENEDSPKKLSPEVPKFQFSVCDEVDFMMLATIGYQDIREIDSQLLAEQITRMESALFQKVIPQHCLGSIWSRRDKKHGVDPTTVAATVDQFNDITMKVMSTILEDKLLRPITRGLVISKWIDVAQACRELKNFSALKAIISALQSHPIHRLRRSWNSVPKSTLVLFEDLANIFVDDNNFETWRQIINKEGTAKFATISPRSSKKVTKSLRKMMSSDKLVVQRRDSWHGKVNGTVPYLGTFLSDLIKIDSAYPDTVEDGLINFEKKRKEFEVVAQIRLLQMASKTYQIFPDEKFLDWFNNINVLSYQQCCTLSEELESSNMMPSSAPTTPTMTKADKPKTYRKFFSFTAEDFKNRTSTNSTTESVNSSSYSNTNSSNGKDSCRVRTGPEAKNHSSTSSISSSTSSTPSSDDSMSIASIDNQLPTPTHSASSTSSSAASGTTSLSLSSSSEAGSRDSSLLSVENSPINKPQRSLKASLSLTSLPTLERRRSTGPQGWDLPSHSCRIIRVGLDDSLQKEGDGNIYRSLVITHQEHTPSIIKTALMKHHIPEPWDYQDFQLIQLLDDRELIIPGDANVFYAMNTAAQPHFLLRSKSVEAEDSSKKKKSVRGGSQKGSKRPLIKRMSWVKVHEEAR
ncbi:ral guanine nucleotide dissociation stimulator-like 1 isoform X2 [Lytechinus variegatus]|uniref:ral guanine nucleotide dissociation stimulator-like 1 isoform X2 n=1 Tax=Lytechinus variegatus TaxID=7654 RepID=UPI001BB14DC6|nr:ral guanine nucleotide dissociation stimulator-like 1 isoform X2 [Lytechinus variegatus]